MVTKVEEASKIKEAFKNEFSKSQYGKYVRDFGRISTLREAISQWNFRFELKTDESLEDLCLRIYLSKDTPLGLGLPPEYNGLRIFYKKTGRFESLY